MRARFTLAFLFAMFLQAQQDPADLLLKAKGKVADTLDRLPRYMCTQTIDRAAYEPDVRERASAACEEGASQPKTHLTSSDRLRLDVAMASAAEMYSWIGESRFSDQDLLDMVHEGAISTGSFAAFLTGIFRTEGATFTYNGETSKEGRTLVEYGFRVPYEESHYLYGEGKYRVVTGYDGTFLVDSNSGDLVRLDVRTSRLPQETGACYASTSLDYGRMRIQGIDFLLPTAARLHILKTDGGERENRTVFSNCHEFLGESTVVFDAPTSSTVANVHGAPRAFRIPPGLPFRVILTMGINTAMAAAGDPIQARLLTPIQNASKILVPAGAAVGARIVRLRQYYGDLSAVALDIKLETIDIAGVPMRFAARPDSGLGFQKPKKGALQRPMELGTLRGLEDRSAAFVFRDVHQPYLISSGLESMWLTAAPRAGDEAAEPSENH